MFTQDVCLYAKPVALLWRCTADSPPAGGHCRYVWVTAFAGRNSFEVLLHLELASLQRMIHE